MNKKPKNKNARGSAAQFFVAGELCRRELVAVVTMGNTPNTDVLCSNIKGTKFVHIQVKTFPPGNRTCSVGRKATINYGKKFIWILAGIPKKGETKNFEYYIIPSGVLAENVSKAHSAWLSDPGTKGKKRKDSDILTVHIPPFKNYIGWSIKKYKNRWDIIEKLLK